jgi:hypothetical protein
MSAAPTVADANTVAEVTPTRCFFTVKAGAWTYQFNYNCRINVLVDSLRKTVAKQFAEIFAAKESEIHEKLAKMDREDQERQLEEKLAQERAELQKQLQTEKQSDETAATAEGFVASSAAHASASSKTDAKKSTGKEGKGTAPPATPGDGKSSEDREAEMKRAEEAKKRAEVRKQLNEDLNKLNNEQKASREVAIVDLLGPDGNLLNIRKEPLKFGSELLKPGYTYTIVNIIKGVDGAEDTHSLIDISFTLPHGAM